MNFRDLKYFSTLADHRNFSEAARICNVTQPALSNQVKKLEKELGAPLFFRTRDGAELTALGRNVLEIVRRILTDEAQLRNCAALQHQSGKLRLGIGVPPTLAPHIATQLLSLAQSELPDVTVSIIEEGPERLADLLSHEVIDLAFFSELVCPAQFDFTPLWRDKAHLVVSQRDVLSQQAKVSLRDIPPRRLIRLPYELGFGVEQDIRKFCETGILNCEIEFTGLQVETILRYVSTTKSCTLVSSVCAAHLNVSALGIACIELAEKNSLRTVGVATRPGCPKVHLLDRLVVYFKKNPIAGSMADLPKALSA